MPSDEPVLSDACTHGVRVSVTSTYLPERSNIDAPPAERRHVFAYTVTITNESREAVTLVARHWVITDDAGVEEHVRGPGVVGLQPTLAPGQAFTYSSGAALRTAQGTMHGEYLMERPDGSRFEAEIPPFALTPNEDVQ
jgi:ApaG protein